jgi:GntR family transcriptional regulator/MocR family aminotransferase
MRIPIDHESHIALYQQIENYLREMIRSGQLPPETRLPATRQLAHDLNVNRITVETAYADLEADGLIFSRVGSGTYVLPSAGLPPLPERNPGAPWPLWQQALEADRSAARPAETAALPEESQHPNPINFAGGVGDSHLFPVDDFARVIRAVTRRDGMAALDYGENSGYGPLRATIAQVLTSQGVAVRPENVLVTAGSQQALALVAQILLRPGDTVLVESPTYGGALDLFRTLRMKIVGVPLDERGMQVEQLEPLLQQHHPRLIYTIPNFQNPTGTCLSSARRRQLIALADRYNVPILEDDFVGDLRYEGRAQPALKSLDPGGRVIYVSTFSKMLMPGLRVGFLVADGPVYTSLVDCKSLTDLTTSSLLQRAVEAYVTVGRYQAHLRRSCQIYPKRRDAMLQAVQRHLPGAHVEPPQGGLYLWLRLPGGLSSAGLLPLALAEGVVFAPGGSFFSDPAEGAPYLRLNFVTQRPEMIEEGILRLGRALRLMRTSQPQPHALIGEKNR